MSRLTDAVESVGRAHDVLSAAQDAFRAARHEWRDAVLASTEPEVFALYGLNRDAVLHALLPSTLPRAERRVDLAPPDDLGEMGGTDRRRDDSDPRWTPDKVERMYGAMGVDPSAPKETER